MGSNYSAMFAPLDVAEAMNIQPRLSMRHPPDGTQNYTWTTTGAGKATGKASDNIGQIKSVIQLVQDDGI